MDIDGFSSNPKETLAVTPAGGAADGGGQQPAAILKLNYRDERALAWLIEQVGVEAVASAFENLAGRRKPYVSNVAKALGLRIPVSVDVTPRETALERIHELRRRFFGTRT
jgi:hypothetical protein